MPPGAVAVAQRDAARHDVITPIAGNLLHDPEGTRACTDATTGNVTCWAGWIPDDEDPSLPSPRTWGPSGWSGLEAWCRRLRGPSGSGGGGGSEAHVLFWSRADTVLSDAPSIARFLTQAPSWTPEATTDARPALLPTFGVIVDPVGMLTLDMLPKAADHIERIITTLAPLPGVFAVVASNIDPLRAMNPNASRDSLGPAFPPAWRTGLLAGDLSPDWLRELYETHLPADMPVLLSVEDQHAWDSTPEKPHRADGL